MKVTIKTPQSLCLKGLFAWLQPRFITSNNFLCICFSTIFMRRSTKGPFCEFLFVSFSLDDKVLHRTRVNSGIFVSGT